MISRLLHLLLPAPRRRDAATVEHLRAQVGTVRAREDAEGEALEAVESSGTQAGAPAAGTTPGVRDASPSPAADGGGMARLRAAVDPAPADGDNPDWRPEYLPAPVADRWCLHCKLPRISPRCSRCGGWTWPRRVPAEHVPSPAKPLREGRL